jgi:hypothetical protein
MTTLSLELKDAEKDQIKIWVDYLRSLDFVEAIKEKEEVKPYLPTEAIKQLYPNQWVLLADAQAEGINILGGRVILNAPDKHQLALKGRDLVKEHKLVRHYYTGERTYQRHIGLIVPKTALQHDKI